MSQHAPDPLGDPAGFDSHEEVELDLEPDPTPGLTEDTVGMYLRIEARRITKSGVLGSDCGA